MAVFGEYEQMRTCSKCESHNVKTTYVDKGQIIDSSSIKKVENEFVTSSEYDFFFRLNAAKEHLHIKCDECGYDCRVNTLN